MRKACRRKNGCAFDSDRAVVSAAALSLNRAIGGGGGRGGGWRGGARDPLNLYMLFVAGAY